MPDTRPESASEPETIGSLRLGHSLPTEQAHAARLEDSEPARLGPLVLAAPAAATRALGAWRLGSDGEAANLKEGARKAVQVPSLRAHGPAWRA